MYLYEMYRYYFTVRSIYSLPFSLRTYLSATFSHSPFPPPAPAGGRGGRWRRSHSWRGGGGGGGGGCLSQRQAARLTEGRGGRGGVGQGGGRGGGGGGCCGAGDADAGAQGAEQRAGLVQGVGGAGGTNGMLAGSQLIRMRRSLPTRADQPFPSTLAQCCASCLVHPTASSILCVGGCREHYFPTPPPVPPFSTHTAVLVR